MWLIAQMMPEQSVRNWGWSELAQEWAGGGVSSSEHPKGQVSNPVPRLQRSPRSGCPPRACKAPLSLSPPPSAPGTREGACGVFTSLSPLRWQSRLVEQEGPDEISMNKLPAGSKGQRDPIPARPPLPEEIRTAKGRLTVAVGRRRKASPG